MHLYNIFVESWVRAFYNLEDEHLMLTCQLRAKMLFFVVRLLWVGPGWRWRPHGWDGRDGLGNFAYEPRLGGGSSEPGGLGAHREPARRRCGTCCGTCRRPSRRRPWRFSHTDILPGHGGAGPDHGGQLGPQQRVGRVPGLGSKPRCRTSRARSLPADHRHSASTRGCGRCSCRSWNLVKPTQGQTGGRLEIHGVN